MANIPFFGSIAKAFQFLFVQRAGTADPAVEQAQGRAGSTQTIHERAADPRQGLLSLPAIARGCELWLRSLTA